MTTLREAAQQALEALEQSETSVPYEGFGLLLREAERKLEATINDLRAALEQPEQEPVAWMVYTQDGKSVRVTDNPGARSHPGTRWPASWRSHERPVAAGHEAALKEKNHE
jgi:hypothetical protein